MAGSFPSAPESAELGSADAKCIGSGHHQQAARFQDAQAFVQRRKRIVQMLDGLAHGDYVEAVCGQGTLRQVANVGLDAVARRDLLGGLFVEIGALDLPAALFHAVEEASAAAADIQQSASGLAGQAS